jgi:hypothetical protein
VKGFIVGFFDKKDMTAAVPLAQAVSSSGKVSLTVMIY